MMAAGGQLDDDLTKSSDDDSTPLCQPCSNDGAHRMAEGYCKTCEEFLCKQCYKFHTLPTVCRNHIMLDKTQMPTKSVQVSQPARPSPCTIPCTDHPEERIKFFCQAHNTVVCGICSVLYHKQCELKYILDMKNILNYKESTNYLDIVRRLSVLEEDINTGIRELSDKGALTEEQLNAVIEEFRAFRKEIEEYFKQREGELMKLAKKMKQEDKTSLEELMKRLQTMKTEVEETQSKLISLENNTSDLFVVSTRIQQRLSELEREFADTMSKYKLPEYRFKRDETVQHLVSSNAGLGKLERTYKTTQVQQNLSKPSTQALTQDFRRATAQRLPNIDVKRQGEINMPRVTGLLLVRPNTLLVVDRSNKKVKAVDIGKSSVTSELSLSGLPCDITSLPGDEEAAITITDKQIIQVISTSGSLSCLRSMKVQGKCYGISSTRHNIVVSFCNPAKVQVLDLTGKVLTTIQKDTNGVQLFQFPEYLTVTMEAGRAVICVTDDRTNIISKFTMDGKLITTYKHGEWSHLTGVIGVGNNQLLVCNYGGNTVDLVTGDGQVCTLLDNEKHGIEYPYCLCYCESEEKLFVGANGYYGDPLSVHKLSHN